MQDVRNAVNINMRLGVAKKGRNAVENSSKYLTWFSWGHENGNLTEEELVAAFDIEFQKVLHINMLEYGRPAPWRKLKNGRYALKE
jgi:hypothetical protein